MTPSPTHKHEASKEQGILSDEIVEKAARAILNRPCATISGDYMLGRAKLEARAALTAVLPEVIEKCAKVADGQASEFYQKYDSSGDHVFFKAFSFAMELGESIRCLIPAKSPH